MGSLTSLALVALVVATLSGARADAGDVVRIDTGLLGGVRSGRVISFRAIPYAAPPVGPLRWRPPEPAAAWSGLRPADKDGEICMQKLSKDNGVGVGRGSEDCLTLNVFTPKLDRGARLPVMVWIHGGGFVNGSGTAALYDGAKLAEQGVVVVAINYRLGRFGFFAHPALSVEPGHGELANYGLMDQIAALKWVQTNIRAFGGDPSKVTLFGESAGGVSVNRLMLIPEARGLFSKAIVESGVGRETSETLSEAELSGARFVAGLSVVGQDVAALRAIPAEAILAAGDLDMTKGEAPIIDGVLVTQGVLEGFRQGRQAIVPYMVGSNSLEIPAAYAGAFKGFDRLTPEQRTAAEAVYGGPEALKAQIITDLVFGEPARALAKAHAKTGAPTWLYRFSVVSSGAPKMLTGAVHASDRQYVFQTLSASPWPTDQRDALLAKTISAYWVAFAKTGDPNGGGRPIWPPYDAGDRLINFTNDGPKAEPTPDAAALDFIGRIEDGPSPAP